MLAQLALCSAAGRRPASTARSSRAPSGSSSLHAADQANHADLPLGPVGLALGPSSSSSTRPSQVGFLESTILGLLPSAVLTRYLNRLWIGGGTLHDPQTIMTTEELIRREGYPVETYRVRTQDGYMPMLIRIPRGRGGGARPRGADDDGDLDEDDKGRRAPKPAGDKVQPKGPVLITHGVLQCSDNWVLRGRDHDLPFLLADAGYDVWLANTRGSTYSRTHTKFADNDFRFWDYTLHEPGVYDLPAFFEKVLNTSRADKLHYIGHSMGTTIFYILGSTRPDLMSKVRLAVHLAPVTYWSRIQSPMAKRAFQAAAVLKRLDMPMLFDNYFSRSNRSVFLADTLCRDGSPVQTMCAEVLFSVVGSNRAQLNASMLPMIFAHFPAGASVGQVAHYYQNYEQGVFHQFDYGTEKNILKYGKSKPPEYQMNKVSAPVAIWYGLNDRLVYHEDVVALSKQLPNLVGLHQVKFPKFNHFDFLWAKDTYSLLYKHVIEVMSQY